MKKLAKVTLSVILAVLVISASAMDGRDEKIVTKNRESVENAAPDDWYTLAFSAKKCLDKKVNCKEVATWIDRSLAIKETSYNLEVKGDYYVANKLDEEALKCYIKAVSLASENNNFDTGDLQKKIAKIIDLPTT
ncbi:hypothetical protein ACFLU5_16845 [Bacteroidota bacterium]